MLPERPSTPELATTVALVPKARWKRIEDIFGAAIETDEPERERFVAAACGDDLALRAEVLALLANASDADRYIGEIVSSGMSMLAGAGVAPLLDRRIGPYRVVALVGEGGMGAVYLAERDDEAFRRHVAIKVLHAGFTSRDMIARFRDERQILADLDHPGIVRLIDGGTSDDLPYLVMEKVDGVPITQYADARALSVRGRIALVRATCAALAYAHAKHVVHRDIKPSNLLVTADGNPKLVDFGIAKLLAADNAPEREARTRTGMALLTPEYASPEQVRGEPVTPATDIYSLGAVTYELLTGRPPQQHRGGGPLAVMKAICEDDPPLPSAVAPGGRAGDIPRELDNIVMKALRKEPALRYSTIEELDQDLARFLDGRPVSAGPPSIRQPERPARWLRLAAAALLAIAAIAVVVSIRAARSMQQTATPGARDMRRLTSQLGVLSAARFAPEAQTIVYSAAWGGAATSIYTMRVGEPARELLRDAELLAVSRDGDLAVLQHSKLAGVGAKSIYTGTLARTDPQGRASRELARDVISADFSPDDQLAITRWRPGVSTNGTGARGIVEWPIGTKVYEAEDAYLTPVRVSPDGSRVAFLEGDVMKQIVVVDRAHKVTRIGARHDIDGLAWRADGTELWVADAIDEGERCVHAFALDGTRRLVQCGTGMLTLHDVDSAGHVLATSARTDARIHLKAPDSSVEREVQWHTTDRIYDVTPDGRRIVFGPGGFNGPLYVRDVDREGAPPLRIGTGLGVAVSPDGEWVATTRDEPQRGVRHYLVHSGGGREVERIAEVEVKIIAGLMGGWSPDSKKLYNACITHDGVVATCTFSLDGRGTVLIRGKRPGASMTMRSLSPDGKWILGTDGKSTLELVASDGSTSRELPDTPGTRNLGHFGFGTAVGWGPGGRSVFVVTEHSAERAAVDELDLATGVARPWKTLGPEDRSGNVEFTGIIVFAGGDGYAYSFVRTLSDLYLMTDASR